MPDQTDNVEDCATIELRLKLALAVGDPGKGAVPLDWSGGHKVARTMPDGSLMRLPFEAAAKANVAHFVWARDEILVADGDTPAKAATVEQLAAELRSIGQHPVVVRSGRPGNLHLFARVGRAMRDRVDRRVAQLPPEVRPDMRPGPREGTGGGGIRPPLSPHPAGLPVSLVDLTPEEALAALEPAAPKGLADRLGRRSRDVLEHGTGPDRSPGQFSVLMGAAVAGFTTGEVQALFCERWTATERFAEQAARNPRAAVRALLADYTRAQAKVTVRPPRRDDALADLDRVDAQIAAHPWTPRDKSRLALLHGFAAIARRVGRVEFSASLSELALQSGLSRSAVSRRIDDLVAAGWVAQVAAHTEDRAACWRLSIRCATPPTNTSSLVGGCCATDRPDFGADVWSRPFGVGRAAAYVSTALSPAAPLSAVQVAERLGYAVTSVAAVRRHLRTLERVGLATCGPDGWLPGGASLDQAAETAGATGEREWRAAQFRRERERWARQRARRREEDIEVRRVDPETGEIRAARVLVLRVDRRRRRPPIGLAA